MKSRKRSVELLRNALFLIAILCFGHAPLAQGQPKGEAVPTISSFGIDQLWCTNRDLAIYELKVSQSTGASFYVRVYSWTAPPGRDIVYANHKEGNNDVVFILLDDGSVFETTDLGRGLGWGFPRQRSNPDPSGGTSGYKKLVGDALYVQTTSGVFVSRDSAASWTIDTLGVGKGLYDGVAVDTLQQAFLAHQNGLFKQHPDSNVWHKVGSFPGQNLTSVYVDRKNRIFASTISSIYLSTDDGASWQPNNAGISGYGVTNFGDDIFNNIYALAYGEVFRSTGGTSPWVRIDTSISNYIFDPINSYSSPFYAIAGDSAVYLATYYGVFTSSDQGATWSEDNREGGATTLYGYVKTANRRFISTNLGLYYQNNGDSVWTKSFPSRGYETGAAIYADNGGNLYTLGPLINKSNSQAPGTNWKSTDGGTTWFADTAGLSVAFQSVIPIYFADENGVQHYSFKNAPAPVYKKGSGTSWVPDTDGLGVLPQSYPNVFASDHHGNLYWAITNSLSFTGLLYRRPIAGGTWVLDTAGLQGAIVYSVSSDQSGNLYAGTYGGGLYKKTGGLWSSISLPNGLGGMSTFVTAVDNSGALWTGFSNLNGFNYLWHGIYYTTNSGASWNYAGLDSISVRALLVYGDSIYAVSYNDGLFILTRNGLVDNVRASQQAPMGFNLSQNYPNPFNPTTNIRFSLATSQHVSLIIYDEVGREVKILLNEKLAQGEYVVPWNASGLSSGAYFYRLKAEGSEETKKMLLVK